MSDPDDLNIDVQTLRIVRAIEQTGSITGAARALGTTQPAISQHIQRAERRLAMSLIVRRGRSIELTEVGRVLGTHAGGVLDALRLASADLAGLANLRSGNVRLVGFPSASSTLVPRLISGMQSQHRGLSIRYTEAEPPEAAAMIVAGQADVALVFSYPGDDAAHHPDAAAGLVLSHLYNDGVYVLLADDHPLADEEFLELDTLADDQWIAGCPRCRSHLMRVCELHGYEPDITYETDNANATIGMVAHGLGIALVTRLSLGTALLPSNVRVKKLRPEMTRTISVLVNNDKRSLPAVAAVLTAIAAIDGSPWRLRAA
ncbi:LysR family transcriptional regulator [Microbacteriaceae bacterium VKM Ac-2854]|nr:LysR family transcriptional regulator [Microbacteriaceae bacterium VKM Ac-2854]